MWQRWGEVGGGGVTRSLKAAGAQTCGPPNTRHTGENSNRYSGTVHPGAGGVKQYETSGEE